MSNFSNIIYLNPNQILINREDRQRKEIDISDIIESISENGFINPIIVKKSIDSQADDKLILVAGERRLEAAKQLKIQIPCRILDEFDSLEAQVIELEENLKRKDLSWRETVSAIGKIHNLFLQQNPNQTYSQTAKSLSLKEEKVREILYVFKNLDEKILEFAQNLTQAISLLHKFKSEKREEIKSNLKELVKNNKPIPDYLKPVPKTFARDLPMSFETNDQPNNTSHVISNQSSINPTPVLNLDFLSWIKDYSGQKFNLIHLDFPQENEEFWKFFYSFFDNRTKLLDSKTHILLWFNMRNYKELILELECLNDIEIIHEPFIWYKSDIKPNQTYNEPPKSSYETCLILNHNSRLFEKQIQNIYHTPRDSKPICSNQKSIPMFKYFLSTFVDSETNVFDPTCGSGSALIASEELNCKSTLGLEIDQERSKKANEKIFRNRELRKLLEK